MNCETTQDLLNGYLDGELDLVRHLQIEEHLKTCPSCSPILENHSAVKSAMADDSLYFKAPPDLRRRAGRRPAAAHARAARPRGAAGR